MTNVDLRDRARGALLGLAVGDALGAPLVGLTREQARIKHATVSTFLGGGLYLLAPGDTTGRTAMVRATAVALLAPDLDSAHVLESYLQVLAQAPPGLGEATRASLENIRAGQPPHEAAQAAHETLERRSAGIGPALRAVPYALRFRDEPDRMCEAVLADAALTHADPRAGAAAVALAAWVREHLVGEADFAAGLETVRERLAFRPALPDVLHTSAAIAKIAVRPTAYAPDVLHGVARHVLGAKRARPAIIGAVNEAGEAAALGAATGAVVGARFGASGLPDGWTALLRGAATWRVLGDQLLTAAP